MLHDFFYLHAGEGPIVAAAIHSGHKVRSELKPLFNLNEIERLREEDPHTAWLATVAPARIIGLQSRFVADLNRERDLAVYKTPQDAWGLKVWKKPLDEDMVNRSLAMYDLFYAEVKKFLTSIVDKYGFVVVYDLHTYNHRRDGPDAPPADPAENPDVNLGTANLNRNLWGPVVEGLADDLRSFDFPDRRLDVRENVRFRGGYFSRWIHREFGDQGCAIAIEFKKFFMDEWSRKYNRLQLMAIRNALRISIPRILLRSLEIAGNHNNVLK
jgi:N-formylglutamate deformylase